jgi:hypothetical protein
MNSEDSVTTHRRRVVVVVALAAERGDRAC